MSLLDSTKLFPNDTEAQEYFVALQQNSRRKCIQPGEHENLLKFFKTLIDERRLAYLQLKSLPMLAKLGNRLRLI